MTYASAWARVVLVVPEQRSPFTDVTTALRASLEQKTAGKEVIDVVSPTQSIYNGGSTRLVVTVGAVALAAALEQREKVGAGDTVILATLLPKAGYERELARRSGTKNVSALFLDQPPARQAALIRVALPQVTRVGMLHAAGVRGLVDPLRAALSASGLASHIEAVESRGLFPSLQAVLEDSQVLLATPDPSVFNSDTIANILTACYRRQIPMIGFSPAYVKAGAAIGLYVTSEQIGKSAAQIAAAVLGGAPLPPPAVDDDFTVEINTSVARSLGLSLDAAEIRRRMNAGGGIKP